jgi:Flp pilus assembly protein TadG
MRTLFSKTAAAMPVVSFRNLSAPTGLFLAGRAGRLFLAGRAGRLFLAGLKHERLDASCKANASVEFAMVFPVLLVSLAAAIDMGGLLSLRLQLETAVTAATNYALVSNANVSSANGAALASNLSVILTANIGNPITAGSIIVNNGPSVTITNGTSVTGGTAANADLLYCPTGTTNPWSWGSSVPANTTCALGGPAGKFVTVSVSARYTPIFSSYGFVQGNIVSASAIVQTQ